MQLPQTDVLASRGAYSTRNIIVFPDWGVKISECCWWRSWNLLRSHERNCASGSTAMSTMVSVCLVDYDGFGVKGHNSTSEGIVSVTEQTVAIYWCFSSYHWFISIIGGREISNNWHMNSGLRPQWQRWGMRFESNVVLSSIVCWLGEIHVVSGKKTCLFVAWTR